MPRNVRNFWIDLNVDGVQNDVGTGPRKADGGFTQTVKIREQGSISDTEVKLRGYVNREGKLCLAVSVTNADVSTPHYFEIVKER